MGTYASSYKPAYTPSSSIPRPAPKSYQEQEQNNAEDLWNDQYNSLESDRERTAGLRDQSQAGAQTALNKLNTGTGSNVAAYKASNTAAYQPTQLAQWLSALGGNLSMPSASAGGSVGSVGTSAVAARGGAAGSALSGFDPSALTNFDPEAAGKEYAQGAYGDFKTNLGDQLQTLENKSVGAGRLRSGLFDRDQGTVINRATSDLNDKLALAATTFSGQRLSALQSGTNLSYQRASDLDRNAETAAEARASETARTAQLNNDYTLGAYNAQTSRYGLGINAAEDADKMSYQKASDLDKYGYNQATYLDDQQFQRDKTGLDAAMAEEGRYADQYNHAQDNMGSYASATRDWAAQDREQQEQRDQLARLRAQQGNGKTWGYAAGGPTDAGPANVNQKLALAYGVPYRG